MMLALKIVVLCSLGGAFDNQMCHLTVGHSNKIWPRGNLIKPTPGWVFQGGRVDVEVSN